MALLRGSLLYSCSREGIRFCAAGTSHLDKDPSISKYLASSRKNADGKNSGYEKLSSIPQPTESYRCDSTRVPMFLSNYHTK